MTFKQCVQLLCMCISFHSVSAGYALAVVGEQLNFREALTPTTYKNSPKYINSKHKLPIMQIAVINQSKQVSQALLKKTLEVVEEQVQRDFSRYYGMLVKFHIFKNQDEVNWKKYAGLFITDRLLSDCKCLGYHGYQDSYRSPRFFNDRLSVISDLIPFAPKNFPNGTPFIIIPIGTDETDYGILPASLSSNKHLPSTFAGIFSLSVSREVLETLHDPELKKFYAFHNEKGGDLVSLDMYLGEVCSPVGLTRGYTISGHNLAEDRLWVSDFVLPAFWIQGLDRGPFNFLNTVLAPFTPYAGFIGFLRSSETGTEIFTKESFPKDPEEVIVVDQGAVF